MKAYKYKIFIPGIHDTEGYFENSIFIPDFNIILGESGSYGSPMSQKANYHIISENDNSKYFAQTKQYVEDCINGIIPECEIVKEDAQIQQTSTSSISMYSTLVSISSMYSTVRNHKYVKYINNSRGEIYNFEEIEFAFSQEKINKLISVKKVLTETQEVYDNFFKSLDVLF